MAQTETATAVSRAKRRDFEMTRAKEGESCLLTSAVAALLVAYRGVMSSPQGDEWFCAEPLSKTTPIPSFAVTRTGPELAVTFDVNNLPVTVTGCLSAYMLLASAIVDRYLETGFDGWMPVGGATFAENVMERMVAPFVEAALFLHEAGEEQEGELCLRRVIWGLSNTEANRYILRKAHVSVPSAVLQRVRKQAAIREELPKRTTPLAGARRVGPWLENNDPVERTTAAGLLEDVFSAAANENRLKICEATRDSLIAALADNHSIVREAALHALNKLAERVYFIRAYPEVLPILDRLIETGINPGRHLLWRWETRLALEHPEAENDLARAKRLTYLPSLRIDEVIFHEGDVKDWIGAGLTRAAHALMCRSAGRESCEEPERKGERFKVSAVRRRNLVEAAEGLITRAAEIVCPRAALDLAAVEADGWDAITGGPNNRRLRGRGYQVETFAVLGRVLRANGQRVKALDAYRTAASLERASSTDGTATTYATIVRQLETKAKEALDQQAQGIRR